MRTILFACLALALVACKKDKQPFAIQLDASCRTCTVEYSAGSHTTGRDTIYGLVQGGDTLIGTGRWNVVAEENEHIQIIVKSIESYDTTTMTATISGDVSTVNASAVWPYFIILSCDAH